jgi:hypothetical protein
MDKLMILVAAREGTTELALRLRKEAARLESAVEGRNLRSAVLLRVADDPFAKQYPARRAYDAVLELVWDGAEVPANHVDIVDGSGDRLGDVIHADLSGALVGKLRPVAGEGEGPMRFLYLMRHKVGSSHARFTEHWEGPHAEFGRKTKGILGYEQFHVDPESSRVASRAAGLGVWNFDGVAELHLRTLQEFFDAAVGSTVGQAALEDEKLFVDGANSVGFAADVVARG